MKQYSFSEATARLDVRQQYLFYLHGLIVEEAGTRPYSDEHGYYEYEDILRTFKEHGFTVISEAREKGTQVIPYAEKVISQIQYLVENDIPAANITVVGASKGGIIAAYVSSMMRLQDLNFVFLAGLFEKCLQDEALQLHGNVLSIHDRADKLSITPLPYFERSQGFGKFREIILSVDLGHGVIYKPHPEWVDPLLKHLTGLSR